MAPTARSVYIAAAANRADIADCRPQDGLVAFGSANLVALWHSASPISRGIHKTLAGHQGNVSALKFLKVSAGRTSRYLVTGDSVGVVRVWKEDPTSHEWSILAVLTGHTHSVSAVAALPHRDGNENDFLVVTGGSDATIHVWRVKVDSQPELLQKIDTQGKIPLALETTYLPASSSIALAIGSTDKRLTIYSSSSSSTLKFTKSLSLEGHSDWIRTLAFITPLPSSTHKPLNYDISPNEVLLASGSQDNYIRLWRFSRAPTRTSSRTGLTSGLEALDALDEQTSAAEGELRLRAHQFECGQERFACASEAVLLGHDAWVTGLHWSPINEQGALRLLSASADRSMILWTPTPLDMPPVHAEEETKKPGASIWTSARRFGEFSSATNLGFFGALWGKDANSVLANGWGGSWHVWKQADEDGDSWEPQVATTGHFGEVRCVEWEPEGEYLMSAAHDMTTRLHGPWRRKNADGQELETWHELARPQIHGYPLSSIAFLDRLSLASGADEKIVRIFSAPGNFIKSLRILSNVELGNDHDRPMAANVPPLGLSNRAIGAEDTSIDAAASENLKDPFMNTTTTLPTTLSVASHPPFEEHLLGSTLWPEVDKLYGHGFELLSIAARKSDGLIATSCKATSEEHAVVRLFDPKQGKMVGPKMGLKGHGLSITRVRFGGEDGKWLLSVSRDRSWRVFERTDDGDLYRPLKVGVKAHARIIWDACFSPDSSSFFTASRDKSVKVWSTSTWSELATIKFEEAATSIACTAVGEKVVLAVGLENGEIHVFARLAAVNADKWEQAMVLGSNIAHVQTVTSLAFCPKMLGGSTTWLASASEDKSVRIIDISFE